MKKSILIFCAVLTTVSVMAIGYINSNQAEAERQCNSERAKLVSLDGLINTFNNVDVGLQTKVDQKVKKLVETFK